MLRIRATVVRVERDSLHGLSCTKSAGRFSRHATLNSVYAQFAETQFAGHQFAESEGQFADFFSANWAM